MYTLTRHAHDLKESIIRATNDTKGNDTVTAIVGAAVGTLHGRQAIPQRWVGNLPVRTTSVNDGKVFTVRALRDWLGKVGARTLYIEPDSPWENGYVESFNGKLRDELLDRKISTHCERCRY